jgi:TPR/MLP1/MLP2-like protein
VRNDLITTTIATIYYCLQQAQTEWKELESRLQAEKAAAEATTSELKAQNSLLHNQLQTAAAQVEVSLCTELYVTLRYYCSTKVDKQMVRLAANTSAV